MSNIHVLNVADELKASSQSLLERIDESRRKAHDAMMDLRDLEETVKTRLRDDHERAHAEEFVPEPEVAVSAPQGAEEQAPSAAPAPAAPVELVAEPKIEPKIEPKVEAA